VGGRRRRASPRVHRRGPGPGTPPPISRSTTCQRPSGASVILVFGHPSRRAVGRLPRFRGQPTHAERCAAGRSSVCLPGPGVFWDQPLAFGRILLSLAGAFSFASSGRSRANEARCLALSLLTQSVSANAIARRYRHGHSPPLESSHVTEGSRVAATSSCRWAFSSLSWSTTTFSTRPQGGYIVGSRRRSHGEESE